MILRSTTFTGKGLLLGASAAAHAALLIASQRVPSAPLPGPPRPESAEIQIEPLIETNAPDETPLRNRVAPTTAATTLARRTTPVAPHDASFFHAVAPTSPTSPAAVPTAELPTPLVTPAAPAPLPRFAMALPIGSGGGASAASGGRSVRGEAGDLADAPLSEGSVDTPARRVLGSMPVYPVQARQDAIEADVPLILIVSREGVVENVELVRRAGHGLDEAAIAAARKFRFTPAIKSGLPVRVRVSWTMEFRLE